MDYKNSAPERFLPVISLAFFLSGSSALIFETAWFHVMGIVLGSSVWSAAAVLTAFMTGLAIGNAVMAAQGHRFRNLVEIYILIEFVIALSGVLVVFAAPFLTPRIAGLLSAYTDSQALLNLSRFGIACVFLLAPTVAMGMTLPVLQKLLYRYHPHFVQSLGRLYGWNTIGAVSGTLIAEFLLIRYLGIKSAALAAAMFNLMAAFLLMRGFGLGGVVPSAEPAQRFFALAGRSGRLLAAPFITGLLLLALEIIWFRCLLLLNIGSSIIFAIMLAVVLAGIGLGGLLVSRLRLSADIRERLLVYLPAAAPVLIVLGFYLYNLLYLDYFTGGARYTAFIGFSLLLMLPACIVSGMLFPLYGEKLFAELRDETRAAGLLTLANTVGAALGSGLATFWLLPAYGLEKSIFILSLGYFLAIVPVIDAGSRGAFLRRAAVPAAALLAVVVAFPFGSMADTHRRISEHRFPDAKLVLVREGLNETSRYYQFERFGKPVKHRLVTNAYSMSGTDFIAIRYMKLFVYLPHVLHQDIRKVLQISYGVGNTAEAVTELDTVELFDVVDISEDILKHSSIIHDATGRYPLRDPRTRVHIEDGRFFLQTTREQYDLITAEPPPPQQAGVVNLYTREYFELIRARLRPRGLASYWLPAHAISGHDAMAIVHAFCLAFDDCSLWAGGGLDFILLGSNGGIAPLSEEALARPWRSALAAEMAAVGLEAPAQLGATFMADAVLLSRLTFGIQPVTDNYPHRISPDEKDRSGFVEVYAYLLDMERRKKLFAESAYVRSVFPAGYIADVLPNFHYENLIAGRTTERRYMNLDSYFWEELANVLTRTDFVTLPLLMLNSSPREQRIIDAVGYDSDPEALLAYAKRQLANRRYGEAAGLIRRYADARGGFDKVPAGDGRLYMLARALEGAPVELPAAATDSGAEEFRIWYRQRFGSSRRI